MFLFDDVASPPQLTTHFKYSTTLARRCRRTSLPFTRKSWTVAGLARHRQHPHKYTLFSSCFLIHRYCMSIMFVDICTLHFNLTLAEISYSQFLTRSNESCRHQKMTGLQLKWPKLYRLSPIYFLCCTNRKQIKESLFCWKL